MFPCHPTADSKNGALFNRKSIDSGRHGRVAVARMPEWQTGRQPQSAEMQQNLMSSRLRLVRLVDLGWIWLIWWIGLIRVNLVIYWRGSAKLELRFIDVQRLYAMVKRGWWNSELRRSP